MIAGQSMQEWKLSVAERLAAPSPLPLQLRFFGAANMIGGYRLFYMLQFAKRAGVARVTLLTDGVFWSDEASDWLIDSGVDEIIVTTPERELPAALAARIEVFRTRAHAPPVRVRTQIR